MMQVENLRKNTGRTDDNNIAKKINITVLLSLILVLCPVEVRASIFNLFGSEKSERFSYEECLLDNLTGVESDDAVFEIRRACWALARNAERLKANCDSDITKEAATNLKGKLQHITPERIFLDATGMVTGGSVAQIQ